MEMADGGIMNEIKRKTKLEIWKSLSFFLLYCRAEDFAVRGEEPVSFLLFVVVIVAVFFSFGDLAC